MNKIEQIKTYLQNQKKEWRLHQSSEAKYRIEAIDEFFEILGSLPEEPASKDLEEAAKSELQNYLSVANAVVRPEAADCGLYIAEQMLEMFEAGAKWQQEQFEQNRLKACDAQTKEESEREWSFVWEVIHEEHRQPTYSDAIEYGMKLQKDKDDRDLLMSDNRNFDKCYELGKRDMKAEMMKDALDADITDGGITKSLHYNTKDFLSAWDKYEVGTKLKLIFIKEDIL